MAYKIEVVEDIPATKSITTPWFDQVGGGVQFQFEEKMNELAKSKVGKLKLIGEHK